MPCVFFPLHCNEFDIFHHYFGDDYPTNTLVRATFPVANVELEIDAIAVLE